MNIHVKNIENSTKKKKTKSVNMVVTLTFCGSIKNYFHFKNSVFLSKLQRDLKGLGK